MKMTRWLLTAFVLLTLGGTAALTMTGCDDDSGNPTADMPLPRDLSTHD
jgi:hypothetical protein